jgi:hypothetical protein
VIVDETFYRGEEVGREMRTVPAATYNVARVLIGRARSGAVFVPIRTMQYLAVLDAEEFIFVDREAGRLIEVAWRHFAPQQRNGLEEPVPYQAVYYASRGPETMRRLQGEFLKALHQLEERAPVDAPARVIKLSTRKR